MKLLQEHYNQSHSRPHWKHKAFPGALQYRRTEPTWSDVELETQSFSRSAAITAACSALTRSWKHKAFPGALQLLLNSTAHKCGWKHKAFPGALQQVERCSAALPRWKHKAFPGRYNSCDSFVQPVGNTKPFQGRYNSAALRLSVRFVGNTKPSRWHCHDYFMLETQSLSRSTTTAIGRPSRDSSWKHKAFPEALQLYRNSSSNPFVGNTKPSQGHCNLAQVLKPVLSVGNTKPFQEHYNHGGRIHAGVRLETQSLSRGTTTLASLVRSQVALETQSLSRGTATAGGFEHLKSLLETQSLSRGTATLPMPGSAPR